MKLTNLSQRDRLHLRVYGDRINLIHQIACDFYGISLRECQHGKGGVLSTRARQNTHYLCRELLGQGCPLVIIGLVTGREGKPYDHASVLYSINRMNIYLFTKTPLDRYQYLDIRNEYHAIRDRVVYALEGVALPDEKKSKRVEIEFEGRLIQRADRHCKDVGVTRSAFIRSAVMEKLKKESNGLPLY